MPRVPAAALLCAALVTAGCGGSSGSRHGAAVTDARERPATAAGFPAYAVGEPNDAVRFDFPAARRMAARGHGLSTWLIPARLTEPARSSAEQGRSFAATCLRVVPARGPDRGGGGVGCTPARDFARRRRVEVTMTSGARGRPGYPPGTVLLAGMAPRGVTRVRLQLAGGRELAAPVRDGSYLFLTRRTVRALVFSGRGGERRTPLDVCQRCDL